MEQVIGGRELVYLDEWVEYQAEVFVQELESRRVSLRSPMKQAELVEEYVDEISVLIAGHPAADFEGTASRGQYVAATVQALNAALSRVGSMSRVTVVSLERAVKAAGSE